MEKFNSLKEAQEAFEKKGFKYPQYKSGAKEGEIKGSLNSLTKIFFDELTKRNADSEESSEAKSEIKEVKNETEIPTEVVENEVQDEISDTEGKEEEENLVTSKPKFHREQPKRFNPMTFKKY